MTTARVPLDAPTPDTLRALAESGRCLDFYDIEMKLVALGYPADTARRTMLDAEFRRDLNERCKLARSPQRRRA